MSDIFLSFSGNKSQHFAEELKKLIEEMKLGTIFLANNNIRSGDDWLQKIYDSLKECRIGIVIFTKENRDNNKWLYLEYGVLSYKVKTETDDNLKVIPIYLDFKETDWNENPLKIHQSNSFVDDFEKSITDLLSDVNEITNRKKNFDFSTEISKSKYIKYIENLKNILNEEENTSTEPLSKQPSSQQQISSSNHSMNKSLIAKILQHIHNFINQNQCILYNHIEYDKLEKYLEDETKEDETTLANAIAYLTDTNHIIFTEEEDLDSYPIEYIGLSIKGQKVIRRRNRKR